MTKPVFFIFALLLFASCFTTKTGGNNKIQVNAAPEYNPSARALHPQFKVYHENDSKTKLYIKLFASEIYFLKLDGKMQAELIVNYNILSEPGSKTALDSARHKISLPKVVGQTDFIAFVPVKDPEPENYWLEVKLEDKYSRKTSVSYINIDRSPNDNSQNYFCMKYENKKPIFNEYLLNKDSLIIQNNRTNRDKLYVKYYKRKFSVPLPPFASVRQSKVKIKPDSVFSLSVKAGTVIFRPQKQGIYRIQADTSKNRGYTQILFDDNYPLFRSSEDLAEALQYITSTEEYMRISESSNIKLALDKFWLKVANDTERARQLIKVWYNRATHANYYFTSYKEGWKTDRGMIYMVFGPPQKVEYTKHGETWVYTDKNDFSPVRFIFKLNDSRVSDNDYILVRDASYETFWYDAVETWRRGMVYHYSPQSN